MNLRQKILKILFRKKNVRNYIGEHLESIFDWAIILNSIIIFMGILIILPEVSVIDPDISTPVITFILLIYWLIFSIFRTNYLKPNIFSQLNNINYISLYNTLKFEKKSKSLTNWWLRLSPLMFVLILLMRYFQESTDLLYLTIPQAYSIFLYGFLLPVIFLNQVGYEPQQRKVEICFEILERFEEFSGETKYKLSKNLNFLINNYSQTLNRT